MQNQGVTIFSSASGKTDLKDILQIVGENAEQSNWTASNVECLGENAELLHQISDNEQEITGIEFYKIVQSIHQTIDGTFEAYKPNEAFCWLLIRVVDGAEFDIETEDKELLNKIRSAFHTVKDLVY